MRLDLEREKALTLRSIKELEFDRAMGKVSPQDFEEMAGRLRARALGIMKQLDAGSVGVPRDDREGTGGAGRQASPVGADARPAGRARGSTGCVRAAAQRTTRTRGSASRCGAKLRAA